MEEIKIDLTKINKRVLVGRRSGEMARSFFNLDIYNENENILYVVVKASKSGRRIHVNSSFFMGMFGKDIVRIADKDKFFMYVNLDSLDEETEAKLRDAVARSLNNKSII